ncbi:hypothetical protein P168DRAFT_329676 [Aspergillus campestris IBT 28561]|uniref:Uncharacterized protein n=1 Tax=Aspergillus campestris (strain IBT 28561) TaxID=1392248 RepID=A0A2I1CVU8_ASPC2|nr:uncharacterized protein P168DRAFT_329676 [Aspergillus campestris IBT 28561]PKY01756.1 hypothetical protein P168DRAFT_329676 [Aspergillus campestris IBT 28561]
MSNKMSILVAHPNTITSNTTLNGLHRLQSSHPRRRSSCGSMSPWLVAKLRDELDRLPSTDNKSHTVETGLLALLGRLPGPGDHAWTDAVEYCRALIESPRETARHACSAASCSCTLRALTAGFAPDMPDVAVLGTEKIAAGLRGRPLDDIPGGHDPGLDGLAGAYSLVLSRRMPARQAVQATYLGLPSTIDEYAGCASGEEEARIRLIALALGAAFNLGGEAVCVLLDGAFFDEPGTGDEMSVEAALRWRAVSGAASMLDASVYGRASWDEGLTAPVVSMAVRDLLDWRRDVAVGRAENAVSAVCGMGFADPFHVTLEAMLRAALRYPLAGACSIAGMAVLSLSLTGSGYRRGGRGERCAECERLLREVTTGARRAWAPEEPPTSYEGGEAARALAKRVVDGSLSYSPMMQMGLGWMQYLVATGRIRSFDARLSMRI